MSHSLAGEPPSAGRRAAPLTTAAYSAAEWGLLTTLPGRVLVAAASAGPGRPARDVAAGLVGLDAVAAGRASDSDLVRAVVAAIYARHDNAAAPTGGLGDLADLPPACRAAVPGAAPTGRPGRLRRVPAVGGVGRGAGLPERRPDPAGRRFLDRLGGALDLR